MFVSGPLSWRCCCVCPIYLVFVFSAADQIAVVFFLNESFFSADFPIITLSFLFHFNIFYGIYYVKEIICIEIVLINQIRSQFPALHMLHALESG